MEIGIGITTVSANFIITLQNVKYKKELLRFAKRYEDLLTDYRMKLAEIFNDNLEVLDILPGSLILLCRVDGNLPAVLALIANNGFALPLRHSKGNTARISHIDCWAGSAMRSLRSGSEVRELELILSKDLQPEALPGGESTSISETTEARFIRQLSEEEDPYYWFVKDMNPNEFDVPLSELEVIPPGWEENLLQLSERLKTNNMRDYDWSALEVMRYTRKRAILSWQHYLKEKSPPNSDKSKEDPDVDVDVIHYVWKLQKLMALTPLYHTNARDFREIISYFQKEKKGLAELNRELGLLSLLPPKEGCRIWSALLEKYRSSPIAYYKYAWTLLKNNKGVDARSIIFTARSRNVISNLECQDAIGELESAEAAMKKNTIPSAKDCQQTLRWLQTIFHADKEKELYKILVDFCSQ